MKKEIRDKVVHDFRKDIFESYKEVAIKMKIWAIQLQLISILQYIQ